MEGPGPPATQPRLVIFEGVDGVGKSTLVNALSTYFGNWLPHIPVSKGSFPGNRPGSLGEWVYRLHHQEIEEPNAESIAPSALQLLHVAAHVDAIRSWVATGIANGTVILDRYWWSTYAYARVNVSVDIALALVASEQPFWRALPRPIVFYVTRTISLKDEIDTERHAQLDGFYREIIEREVHSGADVRELANDGELDVCWRQLLDCLSLPYAPVSEESGDEHDR